MLNQGINFQKWIEENRHLLKPPVCNKKVFATDDFIVMVVGGPNARKDFHFQEGPEFFHQLEGEMVLHTIQDGKRVDIPLKAGEIFNLPGRTPHSPERMANSVGLVIERKRQPGELDGLQWYCEGCDNKLYEEFFPLKNIEKDFPPIFERYYGSESNRTCKNCGKIMEPPVKK
ncbi:MAG: 3-hydroxyanthranilate 3,4-dioxygenase [Planctomycetia bacterium]|nr:3-hydroxyanthranilate 3,4-dioxygenase [Planctomycetia bacterium]